MKLKHRPQLCKEKQCLWFARFPVLNLEWLPECAAAEEKRVKSKVPSHRNWFAKHDFGSFLLTICDASNIKQIQIEWNWVEESSKKFYRQKTDTSSSLVSLVSSAQTTYDNPPKNFLGHYLFHFSFFFGVRFYRLSSSFHFFFNFSSSLLVRHFFSTTLHCEKRDRCAAVMSMAVNCVNCVEWCGIITHSANN